MTCRVRWLPLVGLVIAAVVGMSANAAAAPAGQTPELIVPPLPRVDIRVDPGQSSDREGSRAVQVLLWLTVLTLAPAILIMLTSFTRIVIVLSLVRSAVGVPTVPPNQVIIGLALFLTVFTMGSVLSEVNTRALQPYLRGEITQQVALTAAVAPLRQFMMRQVRERDLALFLSLAGQPKPARPDDVPTVVLIPAFVVSELRAAFLLGSLIFIPFLIIDMIVSSVLMSMGMLMLPPILISLPFKLLLFVLVDGWYLIVRALVLSFH